MKTNIFSSTELKNDFSLIANFLTDKKVLITGGTGFVGSNIVEVLQLLKAQFGINFQIFIMGRAAPSELSPNVTFIEHDVTKAFTHQEHFNCVIHAATPVVHGSQLSMNEYLNIIVNGTKNILDFAHRSKASHLLVVSSGAVYGEIPLDSSGAEESLLLGGSLFDANSGYISGKRISELLAKDYASKIDCRITIARGFAFAGRHLPLDKHFAIGNFLNNALNGHDIEIKGNGQTVRSYMDSEDMVFWLLSILFNGKSGEAYNVGSDIPVTMHELALKVASHFKNIKVITHAVDVKPNKYLPSIKKASSDLNLKLRVDLDTSIQRMIDQRKEA